MQFYLIFALIIAIVAVFFAIQNTMMVTIYFFVWQFTSSLALILLFSLGIGIIITLLVSIPKLQAKNWQNGRLKKEISELTEQKNKLEETNTKQEGKILILQEQLAGSAKQETSKENETANEPNEKNH